MVNRAHDTAKNIDPQECVCKVESVPTTALGYEGRQWTTWQVGKLTNDLVTAQALTPCDLII